LGWYHEAIALVPENFVFGGEGFFISVYYPKIERGIQMIILIGSAWPYANGSLHIGHIAALLPADVIARYYRAKGDGVCFVSGSDCHGTPVAIRAKQENKTPQEISEFYHTEF